MDLKERRELYKAMRSAHDGLCPACGSVVKDQDLHYDIKYKCTSCTFHLTQNEVDIIQSWHADFHINLEEILGRWRYNDLN